MTRHPAANPESRALTGLRGLAALLVMAHHFSLQVPLDDRIPALHWFLRGGYFGVDLFFVLSGFVIAMTYGHWFDGSTPDAMSRYARFLVRRVARLWPLHAFVLTVILLLGWAPDSLVVSPRMALANYAMIQAWDLSTEINPPAWSVSTELFAYLLFPGLALLALRDKWRPWLCLAAVVAALAVCLNYAPPIGAGRRGWLDIYYNYSPLPVLRCLAGFASGILAWRLGATQAVRRLAGSPWFGPLALLVLIAGMAGRVNDLVLYPLLPTVVLGMHFGRGLIHRGFGGVPLHGLGVVSYAVYLTHYTLLTHFPFHWAPLRDLFTLYVAATLMIATALHIAVEVPGRRLLRSVGEAALRASAAWAAR